MWQLILPVLWLGMVIAISFIEAPLKFQAPGITIPLGLGIGRLVFVALNIAEGVIALALIVVSIWPNVTALTGKLRTVMWCAVAILVIKVAVVRPPLNARTDLVLQGADPGQSPWHYVYIVLDVLLIFLLAWFIALQSRRILRLIGGEVGADV